MRAAAPLLVLVVAAGCGGGGDAPALAPQRCAPCPGIRQGARSAVSIAPNLGDRRPSAELLRDAVREGRPGMPARLVDEDELDAIVRYVTERSDG